MTFAAPTCDFYDDGLVHAHEWARNSPPGGHHAAGRRASSHLPGKAADHDEGAVHEHHDARQ